MPPAWVSPLLTRSPRSSKRHPSEAHLDHTRPLLSGLQGLCATLSLTDSRTPPPTTGPLLTSSHLRPLRPPLLDLTVSLRGQGVSHTCWSVDLSLTPCPLSQGLRRAQDTEKGVSCGWVGSGPCPSVSPMMEPGCWPSRSPPRRCWLCVQVTPHSPVSSHSFKGHTSTGDPSGPAQGVCERVPSSAHC